MRIQRLRKGWTQKQVAARLATLGIVVHHTTIGKWEAAARRITLDEALAISIALDVALVHMIPGSFSERAVRRPGIALSRKTPPVSARQLRLCIRGQQPLWGQDERRYSSEVAPEEWRALQRITGLATREASRRGTRCGIWAYTTSGSVVSSSTLAPWRFATSSTVRPIQSGPVDCSRAPIAITTHGSLPDDHVLLVRSFAGIDDVPLYLLAEATTCLERLPGER